MQRRAESCASSEQFATDAAEPHSLRRRTHLVGLGTDRHFESWWMLLAESGVIEESVEILICQYKKLKIVQKIEACAASRRMSRLAGLGCC